jgi:tight adherence protein B
VVIAVLLAIALVAGVPWPIVGLLLVGVGSPAVAVAALVAIGFGPLATRRTGRAADDDQAVWLASVGSELRGGASLRSALVAAADRVPRLDLARVVRLAQAGAPYAELASAVDRDVPGRIAVGPALRLAGASGGKAAAVFDRLAAQAWEDVASLRERRTLTAQARLSIWVVGSLPVVAVAVLGATGRLSRLLAVGPAGVVVMAAGLGLEVIGVLAVAVLLRKVPE